MELKKVLAKHLINARGWKSRRKFVVIESDDWGSIRMPGKDVYRQLEKDGVPVSKSYFTRFDSLETDEDLTELQSVLSLVKDINGRSPVITMNCVLANPDYEEMRSDGYQRYHFKTIERSFIENNGNSDAVMDIYKQAIEDNDFFKPQFHGREHLNVRKFLRNLKEGKRYDILGAKYNALLGLVEGGQHKSRAYYHPENYMAGFEALDSDHQKEINRITGEGIDIFETLFGFRSKSFVAQSLIWHDDILPILSAEGVRFIQGAQQFIPLGEGRLKVVDRFSGSRTAYDQLLWRRNCSFEPSSNSYLDWVSKCLKEVSIAFKWNAPAIINCHRVNFMGGVEPKNREENLILFSRLLHALKRNWPEIEFLSSDELGEQMTINCLR